MLPLGLECSKHAKHDKQFGNASAIKGPGHLYVAQRPGMLGSRNVNFASLLHNERWFCGAFSVGNCYNAAEASAILPGAEYG